MKARSIGLVLGLVVLTTVVRAQESPSAAAGDVYLLIRNPKTGDSTVFKFDRQNLPPGTYPNNPAPVLFGANNDDLFGISADRENYVYTLHYIARDPAPRDVTSNLVNQTNGGNKVLEVSPNGTEIYLTVVPGQTDVTDKLAQGYAYLPPPTNMVHASFSASSQETIVTENTSIYPAVYHGGIRKQFKDRNGSGYTHGVVNPTGPSVDLPFTFDLTKDDNKLEPELGPQHTVRLYPNRLVPVLHTSTSVNQEPFYLTADTFGGAPDIKLHSTLPGVWISNNTSAHDVSHFAAKRYTGDFSIQKTTYGAQRYAQGASSGNSGVGDGLANSAKLGYRFYKRSSCGEGCLNGPATSTGSYLQNPPSRMFFSTLGGGNGITGRAYSVVDKQALRESLLSASGQWTHQAYTSNSIDLSKGSSGLIEALGIADRDASGAWVYYSDLNQNYFAVANTFFRLGGIVYEYDLAINTVTWKEYIASSAGVAGSISLPPRLPASDSQVAAITADGLGNMSLLQETFDPAGRPSNFAGRGLGEVTPDYDAVNPPIDIQNPTGAFVKMVVDQGTIDGVATRDVYLRQNLTYRLRHITLERQNNAGGTVDFASSAPVERGSVAMPELVWVRRQVQDASGVWGWDGPPVYDASMTTMDYVDSYRIELAPVNITEPPIITGTLAIDIYSANPQNGNGSSADPEEVVEDTSKTFRLDNPPVFDWILAGPLGRQNSHFTPVDDDEDGVGSSMMSNIINPYTSTIQDTSTNPPQPYDSSFKWTWTVTHENLSRVVKQQVSQVDRTSAPGPVPSPDTSFTYDFTDPGRYRIDLRIDFAKFDVPQGLNVNATVDDLTLSRTFVTVSHWVEVTTIPGADAYVTDIEHFGPDKWVREDLEDKGTVPARIEAPAPNYSQNTPSFLDTPFPSGATFGNWHAKAKIRFYRGFDYDYYRSRAQSADIAANVELQQKFNGVGKWDYTYVPSKAGTHPPNYDPNVPGGVDMAIAYDGLPVIEGDPQSAEGTMSDESRYSVFSDDFAMISSPESEFDWFEIKYFWFMRYKNPSDGSYVLNPSPHTAAPLTNANTYHLIREGNLSEVWALQRARKEGGYPESGNILASSDLGDFIKADTSGGPDGERLYTVRIPLIKPTLIAAPPPPASTVTEKDHQLLDTARIPTLGTFPRNGILRYSFKVPSDPSAIELVCRIQYPKVAWTSMSGTAAPDAYFSLVDNGMAFGTYKRSATADPQLGSTTGDPLADANDGDLIDFMVADATRPTLVRGTGSSNLTTSVNGKSQTGEFFPGSDFLITVRDNNPYQHWPTWDWTSAQALSVNQEARPRAVFFAYETGSDVREQSLNGMVLTGTPTQVSLGFELTSSNSDNLTNDLSDFDFQAGGATLQGPGRIGVSWKLPAASYHQGADISASDTPYSGNRMIAAKRAASNFYVRVDATNPTDTDALFVDTPVAAFDLGGYPSTVWFDPPAPSAPNPVERSTVWRLSDDRHPLPLFSLSGDEANAGSDDTELFAFAQARDFHPLYNRFQLESVDENGNDAATWLGSVTMTDNDPPHLRVTLSDSRSGVPRVYAVYPEHARSSGGNDGPPYRLHISGDGVREVYGNGPGGLGLSRSGVDTRGSPTQRTVGLTGGAYVIEADLEDPSAVGGALTHADHTGYALEEDTILSVLVEATDNIGDQGIPALSIASVAGTATLVGDMGFAVTPTAEPFSASAEKNPIGQIRKVVLRQAHRYLRGGTYDILEIQAADGAGNRTRIRIPVFIAPYDATFRQVGVTN